MLYCFATLTNLRLLTLVKKPKNAKTKVKSQKVTNKNEKIKKIRFRVPIRRFMANKALVRSTGPKSSLDITFQAIIVRKRLMLWLISCFIPWREVQPTKKYLQMKIFKFFIVYKTY